MDILEILNVVFNWDKQCLKLRRVQNIHESKSSGVFSQWRKKHSGLISVCVTLTLCTQEGTINFITS